MTDYYMELKLDPSSSIMELNKALTQLESTWKRREITNPEKATTMLALIIQARKVFETDISRREYDRDLAKSKEKPVESDPHIERIQQFKKWYSDAQSYLDSKQYDLAKTATDRALSFYDSDSDNDSFLSFVADVYRLNNSYSSALDYINKAIVINPQNAMHYIVKAQILEGQSYSVQGYDGFEEMNRLIQNAKDALNQAIGIAHMHSDSYTESGAYGILACYYCFSSIPDMEKAEEYAHKSIALGNVWGNADRVIVELNKKKSEKEKIAREAISREEERQEIDKEIEILQKQYDDCIRKGKTSSIITIPLYLLPGIVLFIWGIQVTKRNYEGILLVLIGIVVFLVGILAHHFISGASKGPDRKAEEIKRQIQALRKKRDGKC